jgi:hypothetical protein
MISGAGFADALGAAVTADEAAVPRIAYAPTAIRDRFRASLATA